MLVAGFLVIRHHLWYYQLAVAHRTCVFDLVFIAISKTHTAVMSPALEMGYCVLSMFKTYGMSRDQDILAQQDTRPF